MKKVLKYFVTALVIAVVLLGVFFLGKCVGERNSVSLDECEERNSASIEKYEYLFEEMKEVVLQTHVVYIMRDLLKGWLDLETATKNWLI